ncbi:MAG: hypothetical protein ACD_16C00089G0004 [uncultured bacterium]|nr:MAG: hypothetical protein ACD_16C00089G0004 [uncultured bacterium]OFW68586.1 MAG: multidrug ABC transporter ATP-binding protein [Alphaproteobacteria bacterium GWC2_42_16]OFW73643.1 MAG: multidrug ABC transporter ATP-binding protein [Alphaproteobacteria bacterium GWA2_41_27]OFW81615.1 MAG: multidrug ABC transporter ATP-binding protein [Alphaproteobacteria bacterium RIFCSPHIGHO2_12_FULL_42_100]OFW85363.1 MAG: multidrug ABC transporter ATP-binding protein [Alphaproteobacteria bacterium RBG_16_4
MPNIKDSIHITSLSKQFKGETLPALQDVTAVIKAGTITGLVGPDGAGKTTLLRLMAGLLLPTQGKISVLGFDTVKEPENLHDVIGYMPQKFGLYEDLTVIENLNFYAALHNLSEEEKPKVFEKMFHFTALRPFTERLAGNLSGGMKQKLGLACSLLGRPKVLLLDEPSVGVDPISRRELWEMVQELVQQGICVVWSTAYLDEADQCGEVLLLNKGKLLFYGPPKELTKRVRARVFEMDILFKKRRLILKEFLKRPDIIDGVIQGNKLRFVCSPSFHIEEKEAKWQAVAPRFEDAFIDILGGSHNGESALAENMPFKHIKGGNHPILAENLTKMFGTFTAAKDISFEIKQGEIFGLLGPNGAGKSTIFKMLCGILQPTAGRALVSGYNLKTAPSRARSRIGYMAQKFSLYGDLSVQENLDFFSGIYGLVGQRRLKEVQQMISIFDLSSYLRSNAGLLPLGYKQRLALACSLMHEPDVLFLDEPTSGVDPLVRREFWNHINGMVEKGVTIMVTTHFMEEAEYCDRIALIYGGVNIATGTPMELKDKVKTKKRPNPSLEEAFIALIERIDRKKAS